MLLKSSLLALALSLTSASTFAGESADPPVHPSSIPPTPAYEQWDWSIESGYLWQIGSNTSIDYELATAVFSILSPAAITLLEQDNGNALVVRNRVSLITDYVIEGPEDYIITLNGSPSIEYWFADETFALYLSPGGGVGLSNSKGISKEGGQGVEGGQGQDFLLNWFVQSGVRYQMDHSTALTLGVMFQHVSNGGQTEVNPGIDALGITIGFIKTF